MNIKLSFEICITFKTDRKLAKKQSKRIEQELICVCEKNIKLSSTIHVTLKNKQKINQKAKRTIEIM